MEKRVDYLEMTWPEINQAIQDERVLLVCVGSVEQHGPHLPTGVDIFLPVEVCRRVAQQISGVVAPCTNYGYKSLPRSGGGPNFVGTLSLRGTTVIALVKDIFSELIRHGWRKILVLEWHIENAPFVYEGIDEAIRSAGPVDDLKIIRVDDIVKMAFDPELYQFVFGDEFLGMMVEHASAFETSAMLAARPDLVRTEKVLDGRVPSPLDYDILPVPGDAVSESGVFWKATQGTRVKGERVLDAMVEALLKVIEKEFEVDRVVDEGRNGNSDKERVPAYAG